MSDLVQVALITGGLAAGAAIVTQLLNFLSQRGQREEQYRIGLYPRRVAAYQRAVEWLVALQNVANYSAPPKGAQRERFHKMFKEADEWWQQNCLYLDPKSAEMLRVLFLEVGAWAVFDRPLGHRTPQDFFNEAWRVLWKGMGWKHVDSRVAREGLKE